MPHVSALWIYPVKSCKGISLQEALVTPLGLAFDRKWCIVQADTGRFVTQRQHSKMALIETTLPTEAVTGDLDKLASGAALKLCCPGQPPLNVPLVPIKNKAAVKKVRRGHFPSRGFAKASVRAPSCHIAQ